MFHRPHHTTGGYGPERETEVDRHGFAGSQRPPEQSDEDPSAVRSSTKPSTVALGLRMLMAGIFGLFGNIILRLVERHALLRQLLRISGF